MRRAACQASDLCRNLSRASPPRAQDGEANQEDTTMDTLLGGFAFAALVFGQFAAVIAVHGENRRQPERLDELRRDYRAEMIWEGGSS
jgi:hypothetical protein